MFIGLSGNTELFSEERDLWISFKSGSRTAFESIYQKYSESLYKYGMHLCHDEEMVEDVIHDLFLDLWMKRDNLSNVKSINLYLKTCFRNNLLFRLKKSSRIKTGELSEIDNYHFSLTLDTYRQESEQIQIIEEKLLESLNSLSLRQKEIIYLRFYQNMNYNEISSHLNLDTSYVYNVASNAYKKIKKVLSEITVALFVVANFLF